MVANIYYSFIQMIILIALLCISLFACNQQVVKNYPDYINYNIAIAPMTGLLNFPEDIFYRFQERNIKPKLRNRLVDAKRNSKIDQVYLYVSKLELEFIREPEKERITIYEYLRPSSFNFSYEMRINEQICAANINHYSYDLYYSSLRIKNMKSLPLMGIILPLIWFAAINNIENQVFFLSSAIVIYDVYHSNSEFNNWMTFLEEKFISEIEQKYAECLAQIGNRK